MFLGTPAMYEVGSHILEYSWPGGAYVIRGSIDEARQVYSTVDRGSL